MPSSFSTDLKLELMVTGENAGTWGTKTNTNLNLLQQAIAGFQSISIAGGAQTTALTMDNAAISNARNAVIELTGTITGNQVVTIPNGIEKTYIIFNNTVGAFTVQFKTASGTGYTFATTDKTTRIFYSNGTNIIDSLLVNTAGIDTLTNKTLTSPKIGTSILDTNGNELALLTATASAVNELTIANAATGNSPTISATGSDTNVGINLTPKGTGGIVLPAGAVGTPALTTSGDLNTGIYFPSADTIAFTEGGSEAMRIDSDGDVGIGETSPNTKLQVSLGSSGSGAVNALRLHNVGTTAGDGAKLLFTAGTSTDGAGIAGLGQALNSANLVFFSGGNTERMRIASDGKVTIGSSTIYGGTGALLNVNADVDIGNGVDAAQKTLKFARSATTGVIGQIGGKIQGFGEMGNIKFQCTAVGGGSQSADIRFFTTENAVEAQRMSINANGSVTIVGALSKGSGSFKIDHPLPEKKDTHHLVHSFTESPQADLIYRGKVSLVNGVATVNIDTVAGMTEGTFVLLNREVQCFTSNETGWIAVKGSVSGNILTINAQDNTCNDTISWLVIGERQDKHMYDTNWTDENGKVIVEPLKEIEEPEIIDNEFKLNWSIDNLDRKSSNGYVTTIHWRAIATEGKLNTSINGTVSFKDGEPIIPYENLTKETVLGWLFNNISKEEIETKVTEQLETLKNPVVKSGLPWENNNV